MRSRELLRDTRGAATSEGVIVAFFLCVLFAVAIFEARAYLGALALGDEVRASVSTTTYVGSGSGTPDEARAGYFDPAMPGTERWVPLRAPALQTLRIDDYEDERSGVVDRPAPAGGGTLELRHRDDRVYNETTHTTQDEDWPAMLDTWGLVGMRSL